MTDSVCAKAPAKVNLHLKVLSKRRDGYHALESIFHEVPLFDELQVRFFSKDDICVVHCEKMKLPVENTLTKAYNAFCNLSDVHQGIEVFLTKNIPSGAGLGGGSSDAATLLASLNEMFGKPLSVSELEDVALKVGSDVPFFLSGGCAVVTGRGEVIKQVLPRKDLFFVLLYPDVHSSTAEAYSLVDELGLQNIAGDEPKLSDLERVYKMPVSEWNFINTFTVPLVSKYPKILHAMQDLKNAGAEFVQMTGSGSSVFGVFTNSENCKTAYKKLCNYWDRCYCLFPLD
ncbi:MAG: 4-(cytidine 5'-diphospho)-2-C-methyl-D-erythritol kinase [Treponemataceae bacterium]